jgi:hypothetical protein
LSAFLTHPIDSTPRSIPRVRRRAKTTHAQRCRRWPRQTTRSHARARVPPCPRPRPHRALRRSGPGLRSPWAAPAPRPTCPSPSRRSACRRIGPTHRNTRWRRACTSRQTGRRCIRSQTTTRAPPIE